MTAIQRDLRRQELVDLKQFDPLRVISMYRRVVGLNHTCMLPGGMAYTSLIESILEHESQIGRPLDPSVAA